MATNWKGRQTGGENVVVAGGIQTRIGIPQRTSIAGGDRRDDRARGGNYRGRRGDSGDQANSGWKVTVFEASSIRKRNFGEFLPKVRCF